MTIPIKGHARPAVLLLKDGTPVDASNPLPVNAIVTVGSINQGIQNVESKAPLAGGATFNGATRDCEDYSGFGVSVHLVGGVVATNVDVVISYSDDNGVTWREAYRQNLIVGIGVTVPFNQVYCPTRRYARASLVNQTANALAATELITMQRPIP